MIKGVGTSKGIGMGRVLIVDKPECRIKVYKVKDIEAEKKRYSAAKEQFIKETEQLIGDLKKRLEDKDKTALVLQNQIYLINDIEMENGINNLIESRSICAEAAIEETCDFYAKIFADSDSEALNQRVADIEDLKTRIVGILMGVTKVDLTHLPKDTIIVTKELQPSVTAVMDTANVAGIVTEKGGETSHTAILARALEIPAVLNIKGALEQIHQGDFVIVDGEHGEIFINPSSKTAELYTHKRELYLESVQELKKFVDKETVTADGHKVCLAANIGNSDDAAKAMAAGAECVGLFRTEFLFMNGTSMPTEEEQFESYRKAAVICKDKVLTVRTLDIGGDKDISYMGLKKESNPFLGYRAIRFCLGHEEVFTKQLRAILRASAFGRIRIMVPLVTGVSELRMVKDIVCRLMKDLDSKAIAYDKDIKIGVMIETPAACIIADVLAKEADFFSIGTNDLIQYTIAVDRGNEKVSYLYSSFHPSVLRLIQYVIACGKKEQIEVGMCGEAASNPNMIPLLLAFGLEEFSVTSSKVLETRKNIASWTQKEVCSLTKKVMQMETEKEIETYLNNYINTRNEAAVKG